MTTVRGMRDGFPGGQRRSYISTAPFNTVFYTYANNQLTALPNMYAGYCPAGRILRENGKKLFPESNPGVTQYYVGVYDAISFFNGYIDPNDSHFAVYNTDKPVFIGDNYDFNNTLPDLGPSVYTQGNVIAELAPDNSNIVGMYNSTQAGYTAYSALYFSDFGSPAVEIGNNPTGTYAGLYINYSNQPYIQAYNYEVGAGVEIGVPDGNISSPKVIVSGDYPLILCEGTIPQIICAGSLAESIIVAPNSSNVINASTNYITSKTYGQSNATVVVSTLHANITETFTNNGTTPIISLTGTNPDILVNGVSILGGGGGGTTYSTQFILYDDINNDFAEITAINGSDGFTAFGSAYYSTPFLLLSTPASFINAYFNDISSPQFYLIQSNFYNSMYFIDATYPAIEIGNEGNGVYGGLYLLNTSSPQLYLYGYNPNIEISGDNTAQITIGDANYTSINAYSQFSTSITASNNGLIYDYVNAYSQLRTDTLDGHITVAGASNPSILISSPAASVTADFSNGVSSPKVLLQNSDYYSYMFFNDSSHPYIETGKNSGNVYAGIDGNQGDLYGTGCINLANSVSNVTLSNGTFTTTGSNVVFTRTPYIFLSYQTVNLGTPGTLSYSLNAGAGQLTVNSTSGTDSNTVNWLAVVNNF